MKLKIIPKLIASLLVLVLGTSQVAVADEGALDFSVPDADVVLSSHQVQRASETAPFASRPHSLNSIADLSIAPDNTSKSNSDSAAKLFATKRSPGAIAVGAAEGNLTPTGIATSLYLGHVDPGNHVVNRGFCSWNKAKNLTVREADRRCLTALQRQSASTERRLTELGLSTRANTKAVVNGTDLWNQSNSAGPQFASRYKKALTGGLKGNRALIFARVEAFRNAAGQLDASGLFGICSRELYYKSRLAGVAPYSESWRWQCIALDQARRVKQVDKALKLNIGNTPDAVLSPSEIPKSSEDLPELPMSNSPALSFAPDVAATNETRQSRPRSAIAPRQNKLDLSISIQNAIESPQSAAKDRSEALPNSPTPEFSPLLFNAEQPQQRPNVSSPTAIEPKIDSRASYFKKIAKKGDKVVGYRVTSPFGKRIHPVSGRSHLHAGVDLNTPANTHIYAIGKPGTQTILKCWTDVKGGGLVATMNSPSFPDVQFDALHLSWCKAPTNGFKIKVNAGERVAGTGNTGTGTGPHLHFQMRDKETGKRISPSKGFISWVLTGKEPG